MEWCSLLGTDRDTRSRPFHYYHKSDTSGKCENRHGVSLVYAVQCKAGIYAVKCKAGV